MQIGSDGMVGIGPSDVVLLFQGFRKIPRLSRDCVITEKIDGTNGQVYIYPSEKKIPEALYSAEDEVGFVNIAAGNRNTWITPEKDNFGFAQWVSSNGSELIKLGIGRHYGEWWGQGIQRGYGLKERRFSLFNTSLLEIPSCCYMAPILFQGNFTTEAVDLSLMVLGKKGSFAAPGFMKPEGVVVYHTAGSYYFKKTLEGDTPKHDMPKV